ncbi:MAG: hypothetical protein H8E26_09150 [FCB group bacterium]|nr:hypothetical protein [FCB group bacterium]MBL7028967.1 hypothetical protein [Candidatus Neomarinimicrobiota bacterium]MBL7121987.1 hypothetical protein [Candidatus Neomarinimicrobiota bacterium]
MIWIIIYEVAWLIGVVIASLSHHLWEIPCWYTNNLVAFQAVYIGALGGIIYCLRGVYLNSAVKKKWSKDWYVWYYLRPLTSAISGYVSYVFLRAGLLVLDAKGMEGDTYYGYLAFAFIAGYNVDNFMKKLEEVARTIWGISKTRAGKSGEDESKGQQEQNKD